MHKLLVVITLAGAILMGAPLPARAELLRGPYEYPSAVAFEGQFGLQLGLGGYTPGGFKLVLDYTHRFARSRDGGLGVWFFADVGFVVGPGIGVCGNLETGPIFECGAVGYGSALDLKGGIQLTFRTPAPIVPYVKLGVALDGVFARDYCEDSGVGVPLAAGAAGLRWFFTKHLALSAGAEVEIGPAFYGAGKNCFSASHNEVWRSVAFLLGMQYAL